MRGTTGTLGAVLGALLALALAAVLAACGGGDGDLASQLRSSQGDPFEIVEHDGERYVVGHGVLLEMAPGWTDYEPEREGDDGTTFEWAVGRPVEEGTFPSGLQFSMGKQGVGPQLEGLPESVRSLAEQSSGYEFLDEGEADVPGAEEAAFLRFVRDFEYDGRQMRLEQVTLMVQVSEDTTSVVRFLAPAGEWEKQMQEVYDSVRVTHPGAA